MSSLTSHPYHLVDISPWPIIGSFSAMLLTSGLVKWFHLSSPYLLLLGLVSTLLVMVQWWRDVIRESTFQGNHTFVVGNGMRLGMLLFITSEVFFFLSFFWAFFHSSLSPTLEIGSSWPPTMIYTFNPFEVPLLNTMVLLCSGVTVTWAHHAILENKLSAASQALGSTCILGVYFSFLQSLEYFEASFTIADSVFGSVFFVTTGFHGLHVLIGTLFLSVCWWRLVSNHYSVFNHFGFEAAAWYWHFVDVVWLLLYVFFYWWSN